VFSGSIRKCVRPAPENRTRELQLQPGMAAPVNEHGNDSFFYTAVELDSLIAVL